MSIASEISRLQQAKEDLATAIGNKGVTVSVSATLDEFADYVDDIVTGITPTGTKSITTNGTHDVTNYASASVAVPASAVDSGTKSITTNGTHDVVGYASASVNVPSSSPTLISKSITANGTYNASADSADGYSSVTVNVSGGGGGASNYVTGTFKGTTANEMLPITISYNGSGYPIAVQIYPTGGAYNSDGDFYSLVSRYKTCIYTAVKCVSDSPPNYSDSDDYRNFASVVNFYKNSTSDSTNYSVTSNRAFRFYYDTSYPTGTSPYYQAVRFASATTMRVFIGATGTGGGFAPNIEYTYNIVYSS